MRLEKASPRSSRSASRSAAASGEVGGIPALQRMLLERGALHGDCLTVTGRTLAENVADFAWVRSALADGHPVGAAAVSGRR